MSATVSNIYRKQTAGLWAFSVDLGITPDGKRQRREITAKRKDKLVEKRRQAMHDVLDGTYIAGTAPTVSQWWTHWCDVIAAPRVRPRVLDNYRSYGRVHVGPVLGRRKLDALTTDDVRHLHTTMREGGASPRTVQAVHNTLQKALKDAVREGKVARNVCEMMDKPKAQSREREALSLAEVRALVNVIEAEPAMWRARWLMALRTGARQGECLGMEWDRVDLTPGVETADVSWQLQRIPWRHGEGCGCGAASGPARCPAREPAVSENFEVRPCYKGVWFQRPKTAASIRRAPLTPELAEALRMWREESSGEGLVFADAGRPLLPRDDRAAWKELCVRAGVREVDLHSARHTMVTGLLEAGVDPEIIRQIVGHSSLVSTRRYLHVSQEGARSALESWGS